MNEYSPEDFYDFIDAPAIENRPPANIPAGNGNDSFFSGSTYRDSDQKTGSNICTSKITLPEVLLFKDGTNVTISDTAEHLGEIYKQKEILFLRDTGDSNDKSGQIQIVDKNMNLKIFTPEVACSEFEKVARICILKRREVIHAILKTADTARILNCDIFINKLPPIKIVTKCPVIVETGDGNIKTINSYDRDSGIFATGAMPQLVPVDEAVKIIMSSIEEFDFKSPSDQSRAIASIITPALMMGGIENFRAPIEYIEADDSQAGKGFITRLTAAYYNEIPYPINQQSGGVGSLEESFNQALIEGRIFINLDNLKPIKEGVFDSKNICTFMTEEKYFARMLRTAMYVNPRKHIIQMTTNGCSLSKDLMNRCLPVSIRKRYGYKYKKYQEGSILEHIRKNQPRFLGAVFSIIKESIKLGKPKTSTTVHESSFTPSLQTLDGIVQNIMGQAPLLTGYQQVKNRVISPYLQVLRDIALAVIKCPHHKEWLTASDILELAGREGIELPGIVTPYDYDTLTDNKKEDVKKQLGVSFGRAFENHGKDDVLILDSIRIMRKEFPKTYNSGTTKNVKHYKFSY